MPKQLEHQQIINTPHTFPLVVVCENVNDPRNVGMAFRICEAMGVEKLYLCGNTPSPPHKKISRVARSTEQWLPFVYKENIQEVLLDLKEQGYWLCGLEITDKSQDISNYSFLEYKAIALVIGSEQHGISADTLLHLDQTVHINMYGRNTSINVIMAMSIALYEIGKQLKV